MARREDLLSFSWGDRNLVEALKNLPKEANAAVSRVVTQTTDRAFRIAKNKTPVDSGEARSAWRRVIHGTEGKIVNNAPHINVLEFGGYPVTPARTATRRGGFRRGRAILGGAPPPRGGRSGRGTARTQRAPGGDPSMRHNVSKQAPRGMVRSTLEELQPRFLADLDDAINNLPGWS